jgi:xanthine dehydrogenase YagT iron-sulfur-binding subunit
MAFALDMRVLLLGGSSYRAGARPFVGGGRVQRDASPVRREAAHFLCTRQAQVHERLAFFPMHTDTQPEAAEYASVALRVNGREVQLTLDTRTSLLDALREHLGLTGSKKGCDHGQCGACTVLIDGLRINSCLSLAVMHAGQEVTTIEGLGDAGRLHPLQRAFIEHDGFQCGFCTPGQICSAVGMLSELDAGQPSHVTADLQGHVAPTPEEVRERMSGNLCRCAAYPNIVAAILEVEKGSPR